MTITETQRRTLDVYAEDAGWSWADVEAMAEQLYGECVAGLSEQQAAALIAAIEEAN